jgi:cation transport protein ChaC
MSTDAFIHLPHLRGKMVAAEDSRMRMTPERLADWDLRAEKLGRPRNWRLTDAERELTRITALRSQNAAAETPGDLWIYAYGSLMWDPGFHFAEVRLARLEGYVRRFSHRTYLGRGSPDCPGLMLTLEKGEGHCIGLAFRITAEMAEAESIILWRREMLRGGYCPLMLPMTTPQGDINALVFACNTAHPDYMGNLPMSEAACMIARGAGMIGTNREYLENLTRQLKHLQIEDAYLTQLLEKVIVEGGGA